MVAAALGLAVLLAGCVGDDEPQYLQPVYAPPQISPPSDRGLVAPDLPLDRQPEPLAGPSGPRAPTPLLPPSMAQPLPPSQALLPPPDTPPLDTPQMAPLPADPPPDPTPDQDEKRQRMFDELHRQPDQP